MVDSHSFSAVPGVWAVGWKAQIKAGTGNEAGKSITEAGKHQHTHRPAHGLREVVWINFLLGGVTAVWHVSNTNAKVTQDNMWSGGIREQYRHNARAGPGPGELLGRSLLCHHWVCLGTSQCPYVDLNSLQWWRDSMFCFLPQRKRLSWTFGWSQEPKLTDLNNDYWFNPSASMKWISIHTNDICGFHHYLKQYHGNVIPLCRNFCSIT